MQCPAAAVEQGTLLSHINGDLAVAGGANAKLCMSQLMIEGSCGTLGTHTNVTPSYLRHVQPSCGALVPSPGRFVMH